MKRDKIDEFRVIALVAHIEHLARRIPLGTTDYTPWRDELDFIVRAFENSAPLPCAPTAPSKRQRLRCERKGFERTADQC